MSNHRRGTSLVEAISAGACLLLVMTATLVVLGVGLRTHVAQTGRADVEQSAASAVSRLTRELTECHAASLRQDEKPAGIVFLSPRDVSGAMAVVDGSLQWQKEVCYYLETINGVSWLVRKEAGLPSPLTSARVGTITDSTAWFRAADVPRRAVAANVSGVTCVAGSPLRLTLTVSATTLAVTDAMTLQTSVLSRN